MGTMKTNGVSDLGSIKTDSKPIPPDLEWIQEDSPGFSLCGDKIKVIFSPGEFYSEIIKGCSRAKQRITLSALYIGTGSLEDKLVELLDERLKECGKDLSVSILLDALRDSRDQSARHQLLPLLRSHPHCLVSLYHTPDLRGIWLRLLPLKVNEMIGVQHIKMYVFDNDVIISGANLTKEYFTDRQDRYMLISECPPLADFCHGLLERVISISLRLTEDNCLVPSVPHLHPYLNSREEYEKHARDIILRFYQQALQTADKTLKAGDDTWVFPLLQLPPLHILQDSTLTCSILESFSAQSTIHLASPYFNLPEEYVSSLLHKCRATFNIIIPHPTAIDFFGARGFAGQIPWLYSALASSFVHTVEGQGKQGRVTVSEFRRPGESFHCKGLWFTAHGDQSPFMTIVGSSNFNYRSVKRDLECQLVIMTSNNSLRSSLRDECQRLLKHAVPYTHDLARLPERKPKLWHHLFVWLFKSYL